MRYEATYCHPGTTGTWADFEDALDAALGPAEGAYYVLVEDGQYVLRWVPKSMEAE